MPKTHRVIVNGEQFTAARGEVLLDAALKNGVHIPHDCRSGHCGTCSVRIVQGELFGNGGSATTKACQSWIVSDVEIAIEDVPEIATVNGRVTAVRPVAPDVVAVSIAPRHPIEFLPGQYLQVQFKGFGPRCYSPTVPWIGEATDAASICMSAGRRRPCVVGPGRRHQARTSGQADRTFWFGLPPTGSAGRLVLVGSGTGFAPLWSIADAAMREDPRREMLVVVGARSMEFTLDDPRLVAPRRMSERHGRSRRRQPAGAACSDPERIADRSHPLLICRFVYAAGSPKLVDAVRSIAVESGATFYADAFVPSSSETEMRPGLLSRVVDRLMGDARRASPCRPSSHLPGHAARSSEQRRLPVRHRALTRGLSAPPDNIGKNPARCASR